MNNGFSGGVGYVPIGATSSSVSPLLTYRGVYNATTNNPTLVNGTGTAGDWYYVTVAGTNNPTGQNLAVGSAIAYNGIIWESISNFTNNTDDIVVSTNYIVINNQTIAIGQALTLSLGILQGQILQNQPMVILGDIIYALANGVPARLGGNVSTAHTYLRSLGSGSAATAPSWEQIAFTELVGQATTAQITDNAITNAKLAQATSNTWKGNNTGSTANVADNATSSLTESTSSVLTIMGGANTVLNPTTIEVKQATTSISGYLSNTDWNTFNNKLTSTLTGANMFVGNVSNVATGVAMSGDSTLSNTGSITNNIGTNLRGGATNSLPYQSAANTTAMLSANATATTQFLSQVSSGTPTWLQPAMANISDYTTGTWTPADASGAGLTFSAVHGGYIQIGKICHAFALFSYPATADTSTAVIGGLPFTIINNTFIRSAGNIISSTTAAGKNIFVIINTTTVQPVSTNAGSTTNANNTGAAIYLNLTYYIA